jgi:hypothetical protein
MKPRVVAWVIYTAGIGLSLTAGASQPVGVEFDKPVRLKGGDEFVRVESPGWAAPCWDDIDGDGKKDLLVGQFSDGKIRVFKGLGGEKLARGEWLKAEGKVAKVPGVW